MTSRKVFKFPDGNGGYVLKCRDAEGLWHLCDNDGNLTGEEESPGKVSSEEEVPPKSSTRSPQKRRKTYMKISVVTDSDTGRMISDYAAWKSASEHRQISRSQVMLKAILGVIRRDHDFLRFNSGER